VLVALQETIRRFEIPREPFLKLIQANRMDQRDKRHPTYQDLLYYCDHSANPVGHLFLYLFGYRDQERQRVSDATCTALQLANFWQDVARDYGKGRIYQPLEDLDRFGYSEAQLAQGLENEAFRQLLAFEVDRAMELFRQGAGLLKLLDGPVKLDVALFIRGGVAILEAIRRQDYHVLTSRPRLSRGRKAGLFWSTWLTCKLGLGLGLPGQAQWEERP
jgi:squalene synthase HpnC